MKRKKRNFIDWLTDTGWGYYLVDAAETVFCLALVVAFMLVCGLEVVVAIAIMVVAIKWSLWWLLCYIPLLALIIVTVAVKNRIMAIDA